MKKNVLALSIAAMIGGFAGSANALTAADAVSFEQNDGGSGHILVVPYFTTQNDNMSVIHVVNTDTVNGKALKVRFRGAANSDDILDFTVFLSPFDVWTGSVQADANGSYFQTYDTSCTYPDIRGGVKTSFVQDRLSDGWSTEKRISNTKEGYVEVLNMADVKPGSDLFKTIKHSAGKPTCAESVLANTLSINPETPALADALGYETPTGGLTGDWYILNVNQTTTFSGAATAIKALNAAGANGRGNFVAFPQDNISPSVNVDLYTADPLFIGSAVDAAGAPAPKLIAVANYDLPDLSTPYLTTNVGVPAAQASALTTTVANNGVSNQFAIDEIIQAKTDWVLSMPLRRYSVGANYAADSTKAANYRVFNTAVKHELTGARFFTDTITSVDADGNICVNTASNTFYDREEASKTNGAVISPGTQRQIRLCGEVNVLAFKDGGSSVLGATVARQTADIGYENGWGKVNYATPFPLVGSSFIKLTNNGSLANNFSGTYGITWPHRFSK